MLTIAGGIILAIVIIAIALALICGMFSGFGHSGGAGIATMVIFGIMLLILATCVFG